MITVPPPPYVPAHGLLKGKSVLITAAAGGGIGFVTVHHYPKGWDYAVAALVIWADRRLRLGLRRLDQRRAHPGFDVPVVHLQHP